MSARGIANSMSAPQRDILLRHIEGPVKVIRAQWSSTEILFRKKLIRDIRPGAPGAFPKESVITTLGREVACFILGDYADALIRAGYLEREVRARIQPIAPPRPKRAITHEIEAEMALNALISAP